MLGIGKKKRTGGGRFKQIPWLVHAWWDQREDTANPCAHADTGFKIRTQLSYILN